MKMENCIPFLKKNRLKIAFLLIGIVILLVALHIFSHRGTDRRVFIFPVSGSSRNQKEVRYLDGNPVQGKIAYYVDELVLGPSFYRGRALFTPGTKVEYCFLRDKTLYVGLSEEAMLQKNRAVSVGEGARLLKENIRKNFAAIKSVELFIDGNYISD